MRIEIRNTCADATSYRAARVKSLFNAEDGTTFHLDAELPLEGMDWRIGVIVGPSGSGKTSLGARIFGPETLWASEYRWPDGVPLIDAIAPGGDFDEVTGALAAVGLGSVPSWLRPYHVLSNGEKFRAQLAMLLCEQPERVVVDEFTSVVDRQIAKMGSLAFAKAWRRGKGQCVLLTPHYDVLEWIEPDWIFDTARGTFARGSLRRPRFDVEIWKTDSHYWRFFKPHYYLDLPMPIGAQYFVGTVDGELVCHAAMATKNVGSGGRFEGRLTRLVVMPEWQGAGVGLRFLNTLCERNLQGENKWGKGITTSFHTSHPGLCMALRRDRRWRQISCALHGTNQAQSARSIGHSFASRGISGPPAGFGGHFRAIQGFRYYGQRAVDKATA